MEEKQEKDITMPDQKRMDSIRNMRKLYRQKRNAIKTALMNVDTKPNNKIIFDDEDNEDETTYTTDKKDTIFQNNTGKRSLFEEEDDEDKNEYNFEVKEQFQGKKGKKLMALQLKFKNDKRFKMDEKFLEDVGASDIEEDKPDNQIDDDKSIHSTNGDEGDEMEVTAEEKQKELLILEQVLGKKFVKNKDKDVKNKINKSVGMVRYDPMNPEHNKYIVKQDKEVENKQKKKKEKVSVNAEVVETERPEVSKETFYEVQENLKQTFSQDKPFSLLSLFASNKEQDNTERDRDNTQIEQTHQDSFKTKEKNPFRYDSSNDGSDHEDHSNEIHEETEANEVTKSKNNGQNVSLGPTKLWREPFFFKKDDYRFQEGIDFVRKFALDDNEEFKQVRRNIKEIVRAKVRNNLRKNKPFRKKLGGRRLVKIKRAMKNR